MYKFGVCYQSSERIAIESIHLLRILRLCPTTVLIFDTPSEVECDLAQTRVWTYHGSLSQALFITVTH